MNPKKINPIEMIESIHVQLESNRKSRFSLKPQRNLKRQKVETDSYKTESFDQLLLQSSIRASLLSFSHPRLSWKQGKAKTELERASL